MSDIWKLCGIQVSAGRLNLVLEHALRRWKCLRDERSDEVWVETKVDHIEQDQELQSRARPIHGIYIDRSGHGDGLRE